jgi:hypothetical protein
MAPVYICYARATWSIDMITRTFNAAFDDDIVEVVDERIFVDKTGFMYKLFIVVFSHTNELFQEMVLKNKKAREDVVLNPLIGDRIEKYLKYTRIQSYWDISQASIRIRLEEETERIERIKEVDRVMFAEADYID